MQCWYTTKPSLPLLTTLCKGMAFFAARKLSKLGMEYLWCKSIKIRDLSDLQSTQAIWTNMFSILRYWLYCLRYHTRWYQLPQPRRSWWYPRKLIDRYTKINWDPQLLPTPLSSDDPHEIVTLVFSKLANKIDGELQNMKLTSNKTDIPLPIRGKNWNCTI